MRAPPVPHFLLLASVVFQFSELRCRCKGLVTSDPDWFRLI